MATLYSHAGGAWQHDKKNKENYVLMLLQKQQAKKERETNGTVQPKRLRNS
jgi:hypothetical protein